MKYVETVLQPNETVRHLTRPHWIVYARGAFWLFVGICAFVAYDVTKLGSTLEIAGAAICVVGVLYLFVAWLRRLTTEIAVTDRRIIYKRGLVSRHTVEMNMAKVESIDVNQSMLGRVLGYGTIIVRGTGAGLEPLRTIQSPIEFRNSVTVR